MSHHGLREHDLWADTFGFRNGSRRGRSFCNGHLVGPDEIPWGSH